MVEVGVVGADAVVLVRVRVLPEQDVRLLQRSTETMKRLHPGVQYYLLVVVWSSHINTGTAEQAF